MLMALGEGGIPQRLGPTTLEWLGPVDFGLLANDEGFCAHYKSFPGREEKASLGVRFTWSPSAKLRARLRFIGLEADGRATELAARTAPLATTVHDIFLTEKRMVAVMGPSAIPPRPWRWMCGLEAMGRSMQWRPEVGTQIYALDFAKRRLSHTRAEAMVPLHTVNAWDEGDDTILDLCDGVDPEASNLWFEVMEGRLRPPCLPTIRRFRLDAGGALSPMPHPEVALEFPVVDPRWVGSRHSTVFGVTWEADQHLFGTPARLDLDPPRLQRAPMAPDTWAGECLPIAKGGEGRPEGDVWLACEVNSAVDDTCEVQILAGADLAAGPVARMPLPQHQRFRLHGVVVDNAALPPTGDKISTK